MTRLRALPSRLAINAAAWLLRCAFSLFLALYERSEQRREWKRRRAMLRYRGAL